MINTMRLIKIFLISLTSIILILSFLIYFLLSKSIPDYDSSYKIKDSFGTIKIIRDRYAIPHIFAEDNRDLFFGLGFAHAQDRLWQMVLKRRFAHGKLAEVFGEDSLPIDDFMRRMDIKNLASFSLQFQSQRTQEALESYSKGVNAWLGLINEKSLGKGSPEFFIYNLPIRKWDPVDSLSLLRLDGLLGSSQTHSELLILKAILKLKNNKLFDLFLQDQSDKLDLSEKLLKKYEDISYFKKNRFDNNTTFNPIISKREIETAEMLSIAPVNTVKSGSLLSHNVHSKLTAPNKFMLARMEFSSGSVVGLSVPGIPAILSGKNSNISWARSLVNGDQNDIFIEQLIKNDNSKYKSSKDVKTLVTRQELIKIKKSKPSTITLSWTQNGPIIPAYHFGLKFSPNSEKALSFKSNALIGQDMTMTAHIDLMFAEDIFEAIDRSANHVTPIQNLMIIDQKNIAMKLLGKIPKRASNHDSKGLFPSAGWEEQNRWDNFFDYQDNPVIINPKKGYIINTGSKFTDKKFPKNVTYNWTDTQKISRLQTKFGERDIYTPESLRELQLDTISFTARSLLGLIAEDLWYEGKLAPKGSNKHSRQHILKVLSTWNGDMSVRTFEPILYKEWVKLLFKRIIQDDFGSIYDEFEGFNPIFMERVFKNMNNSKHWCDINQTNRIETCQELAKDALDDTIFYLTERFGKKLENWNSSKTSRIKNHHNPLGASYYLSWLTNITHKDTIGEFTLHGGKILSGNNDKLNKSHGSVFKAIYDLADENNNIYILSTGQSGHFLSKHYDDLAKIYRNGDYIQIILNEDLLRVGSKGITYIN